MLGTLWVVQARSSAPSDFGADAGFARDMQTHHAQAVEMAFLVRDRTDDEEVRTVAYDIITSQQQQAGQMYGWLVQWGLDQTGSRPPMAWVGGEHAAAHAAPDGTHARDGHPGPARRAEGGHRCRGGADLPAADDRPPHRWRRDGAGCRGRRAHPRGATLAGAIAAAQTSEIQLLQQTARRPLLSDSASAGVAHGAG